MTYARGDTVVHPQHGPAVVEAVVIKDLGQGERDYLQLYVKLSSLKILVPAGSVERIGIRSLASRQDAEAILALLEEESDVPMAWPERNTATRSRMQSNELEQLAMVVRDLSRHQRRIGKPLNMGEKTALDKCLGLLANELALSLDMSEDETVALLKQRVSSDRAVSGDAEDPLGADISVS